MCFSKTKNNTDISTNDAKCQNADFIEPSVLSSIDSEYIKNDNKNIYIILDNGHGENTPGKRSPDGKFREYKYARLIVDRLFSELTELGYSAIKLVPEEYDVSLSERVKRANSIKAGLSKEQKCVLVSVHVNAAGMGDKWYGATGFSVYTSKGQNNSDLFATCIWDAAKETFNEYDVNMKLRKDACNDGDPDYEENFTIIYGANMPAVLTENFFMDNRGDVEFLETERGKEIVVEYHKRGIMDFVEFMSW